MINHVWSVLCRSVTNNEQTGQISLNEVVEQLRIITPPRATERKAAISATLVSLWWQSDEDSVDTGWMRLLLQDPDGNIYANATEKGLLEEGTPEEGMLIDLTDAPGIIYQTNFEFLPVRDSGWHKILIEFRSDRSEEWRRVAFYPLNVLTEIGEE